MQKPSRPTELTSITLQLKRDLPVGHCVSLLEVPNMNRKLCHRRENTLQNETTQSVVMFPLVTGSIYVEKGSAWVKV